MQTPKNSPNEHEAQLSTEARSMLEAGLESGRTEAPVYLGSFSSYGPEDAAVHASIMDFLRTCSADEFKASLVDAGICTEDGRLTQHYERAAERPVTYLMKLKALHAAGCESVPPDPETQARRDAALSELVAMTEAYGGYDAEFRTVLEGDDADRLLADLEKIATPEVIERRKALARAFLASVSKPKGSPPSTP